MKNTSNWDIKLKLDDNILKLYNLFQRINFDLRGYKRKFKTERNKELQNLHKGKRCFIIGNGPSIKNQDLTMLKGEITFFANMFYKHPQINLIQPTYYAIIDPKLQKRIWPLNMIDEILETCPGVKLFLNAKASVDENIYSYTKKADIYWLYINQHLCMGYTGNFDITKGIAADNVIKVCMAIAFYMGFKDIYLLGMDLNGLFLDLLNKESHFSHSYTEEIFTYDMEAAENDLWQTAHAFRAWRALAEYSKRAGYNVVNLTQGGLLNCFPRARYEDTLHNLKSAG